MQTNARKADDHATGLPAAQLKQFIDQTGPLGDADASPTRCRRPRLRARRTEQNQRHVPRRIHVGLNLSYRDSTMATRIWLEHLQELVDRGAQVVEVLPEDDYAPAHLPGAVNLPLRELDEHHAAVLDRTRPVVVYCWDSL